MISSIVYSTQSAALIAQYNAASSGAARYWGDEQVTHVRKEIKAHYIREQRHLCCYCGLPDPSTHGLDWDVEHVVPQSAHPEFLFTETNLGVACRECNSNKGAKETLVDPATPVYPTMADGFLVVHPHFDEWSEHILRDHLTFASYSEKGEWTIKECRLNRFDEREVGLRYAISDNRWEETVRELLVGGATLQQIADQIQLRISIA